MGNSNSRCAELCKQMGWKDPEHADNFMSPGLIDYLQEQKLEVCLPRHAPQNDITSADTKPREFPRPAFVHEGYKMHLALMGPSTACRDQFLSFLPKMAMVFKGPVAQLGTPGRVATPYYFLDDALHKMVLWDLPEITYRQSCDSYIRELGLLYIDCVFLLFSEKYLCTDVYQKLLVQMALHGVPAFVVVTQTSSSIDQQTMRKIQAQFQQLSCIPRMFNPDDPSQRTMSELVTDFFKEVAWNRGKMTHKDYAKDASQKVLGQTVRIKDLSKKPEFNGKCGVCVGYDVDAKRYLIRVLMDHIERDLLLQEANFSILKPKMLEQLVRVKDLQSRPELNGRYGFVDAFLRDSERYRVFIPDVPGQALALSLKSGNLDLVTSTAGAAPIQAQAAAGKAASKSAPKAVAAPAAAAPPAKAAPKPQAMGSQSTSTAAAASSALGAAYGDRPAKSKPTPGEGPTDASLRSKEHAVRQERGGSHTKEQQENSEAPPLLRSTAVKQPPRAASAVASVSSVEPSASKKLPAADAHLPTSSPTAFAPKPRTEPAAASPAAASSSSPPQRNSQKNDLFSRILSANDELDSEDMTRPAQPQAQKSAATSGSSTSAGGLHDRLMASLAEDSDEEERLQQQRLARAKAAERLLGDAAGAEADDGRAALPAQARATPSRAPPSAPSAGRLQLSLEGLLGMKVWAVYGNPDEAEDIVDHLMDCGKIVLSVWPDKQGGQEAAQFGSFQELCENTKVPRAEVAVIMDHDADLGDLIPQILTAGVHAVLLQNHADGRAWSSSGRVTAFPLGIPMHEVDVFDTVQPGLHGLPIAPLD